VCNCFELSLRRMRLRKSGCSIRGPNASSIPYYRHKRDQDVVDFWRRMGMLCPTRRRPKQEIRRRPLNFHGGIAKFKGYLVQLTPDLPAGRKSHLCCQPRVCPTRTLDCISLTPLVESHNLPDCSMQHILLEGGFGYQIDRKRFCGAFFV